MRIWLRYCKPLVDNVTVMNYSWHPSFFQPVDVPGVNNECHMAVVRSGKAPVTKIKNGILT